MNKKVKDTKKKDTKKKEIKEKTKKQKKEKTAQQKALAKERNLIIITVVAFLVGVIGILTYLYYANWHYGAMMIKAMKGEGEYYDMYGNSFVLSKDKINNRLYKALKYSFVDFDEDGRSELIAYIAEEKGHHYYMIFRYNGEEKRVYGYLINYKDFVGLRKDGTVATNGHDGFYRYYDINFDGNTIYFKDEAVFNRETEYYKVYESVVYKDMFDKYVKDWLKRESCEWEYDLVN